MRLRFRYLSPTLRPVAQALADYFARQGYVPSAEAPLSTTYSFRPTLLLKKRGSFTLAVEVRGSIRVEEYFKAFALECERAREPIQIYVAAPSNPDAEPLSVTLDTDRALRDLGIGVFVVEPTSITIMRRARPQSLRFVIPPGRSLAKYDKTATEAATKFNDGQPVDAIRDMTEAVENQVRALAKKASKKSRINLQPNEADSMDLEGLINCLSASEYRGQPQTRFLEPGLSTDLKSFKGARNLSHHPRSTQKQRALHAQVYERMEMAVRLMRELIKLHRFA